MSSHKPLTLHQKNFNTSNLKLSRSSNLKPYNKINSPRNNPKNSLNLTEKSQSKSSKQIQAKAQNKILKFEDYRKILDLCVEHNSLKDAQLICEKFILEYQKYYGFEQNSNQRYNLLNYEQMTFTDEPPDISSPVLQPTTNTNKTSTTATPTIPQNTSNTSIDPHNQNYELIYEYSIYILAKSFYLRGQINEAIIIFDKYPIKLPSDSNMFSNSKVRFLKGQCLFDLGRYEKCVRNLLGREEYDGFLVENCQEHSQAESPSVDENETDTCNNAHCPNKSTEPLTQLLDFTTADFHPDEIPFTFKLLAFSFIKLKKYQTSRLIFKHCLNTFPYLWTTIDAFLNTFSTKELASLDLNFDSLSSPASASNPSNELINYLPELLCEINLEDRMEEKENSNVQLSKSQMQAASKNMNRKQKPLLTKSQNQSQKKPKMQQQEQAQPVPNQNSIEIAQLLPEYKLYLKNLATTFTKLLIFDYQNCIKSTYNPSLNNSSFAHKWRGISSYQLQKYEQSLQEFNKFKQLQPYNLENLDFHSSVLWHLKKQKELAFLAREAKDVNAMSPFTWICVGNLMSAEKQKSFAIESLKRSVEMLIPNTQATSVTSRFIGRLPDPDLERSLSYALCLLGHELFDINDLPSSLKCYTHAIVADKKSYQAYYGIGSIYMQQEEFSLAEKYFKYTISLNPRSAMIYCNLSQAQNNLGKVNLACSTLKKACSIDPINNQYKFYLAKALEKLGEYKSALIYAEQVKISASKEPSIYELLARIYLKLGKKAMAITCANLAVSYGKGICDHSGKNNSSHDQSMTLSMNNSNHDMNTTHLSHDGQHRQHQNYSQAQAHNSYQTPQVYSHMASIQRLRSDISLPLFANQIPEMTIPNHEIIGPGTTTHAEMMATGMVTPQASTLPSGQNAQTGGNGNFLSSMARHHFVADAGEQIPQGRIGPNRSGPLDLNGGNGGEGLPGWLRDEVDEDVLLMDIE